MTDATVAPATIDLPVTAVRVIRPITGRVTVTLPERDYPVAAGILRRGAPHCRVWRPRLRSAPQWRQVSRTHLEPVVAALLQRYGELTLRTEHHAAEICGPSCYTAHSDAWECTCGGCCARNHGGGGPLMGWKLDSRPDDVIEKGGLILTRTRILRAASSELAVAAAEGGAA